VRVNRVGVLAESFCVCPGLCEGCSWVVQRSTTRLVACVPMQKGVVVYGGLLLQQAYAACALVKSKGYVAASCSFFWVLFAESERL
jgi:hypothetical protein